MKLKKQTSIKNIFIWNIIGSISSALFSVILLSLVNRILGVEDGDVFSIAFAIAQMMLIIGTFQIRLYQATDITNKFSFSDYFAFRIITCSVMLVASIGYVWMQGYELWKFAIIMMICLYRLVEAFADVFQGLFQQKERLDLAGKSVTIKVVVPTAFFGIILIATQQLFLAVVGLFVGELLFFFLYDIRIYRHFEKTYEDCKLDELNFSRKTIKSMFAICFPLFLNAYLIMSVYNMPKMAIDTYMKSGIIPLGTQNYYAIIFMPASVINLLLIIFRPLLTTMAFAWNQNKMDRLYKILGKICLLLVGFSFVTLVGAYFLGIPFLTILYGTKEGLYPFRNELLIIIAAGAINSLANILDNVVTIYRKQHLLIISYIITWITAKIISPFLVKEYALMGAAISFFISMMVLFISILIIFGIYSLKSREKGKEDEYAKS